MSVVNEIAIRIEAEVLEDLHLGTGTEGAVVDAELARDAAGRPFIPREHLKGVLLYRAEMLAGCSLTGRFLREDGTLAEETVELSDDLVRRLFGRRGRGGHEAVLSGLRPADRPRTVARSLSAQGTDTVPTLIWSSSARRAFNDRGPMGETLRNVEFMPAGTRLTGWALVPEELAPALRSLLPRCDRLGGRRRRGAGRVRLESRPEDERQEVEDNERPTTPWGPLLVRREVENIPEGVVGLRLLMRALEPVCLAATGRPDNRVATMPFARGQTLRGAFDAWCSAHGLRLPGQVSVGDALPLPADLIEAPTAVDGESLRAVQVLPIPLDLGFPKPGRPRPPEDAGEAPPLHVPWWARPGSADGQGTRPLSSRIGRPPEQERLKRPKDDEFLARRGGAGPWRRYRPTVSVRLRANLEHLTRREGEPKLFSIEAIDEGTLFVSDLFFQDGLTAEACLEALRPLLEQRSLFRLGRGGAPVRVEATAWLNEADEGSQGGDDQEPAGLALTLTSDCILRDDHLNFLDTLDAATLERLSKVGSLAVDGVEDVDLIHGFNPVSGLPRPAALALRRGSTWRISGDGAGALRSWLRARPALGERTEEGLGRFVLDLELREEIVEQQREPRGRQDHKERTLAWARRQRIPADGPSLSQWWDLRDTLRRSASPQDATRLITELKSGKRLGGKAWTKVEKPLEEILRTAKKAPARAADQVEALARWLRVSRRKGEG